MKLLLTILFALVGTFTIAQSSNVESLLKLLDTDIADTTRLKTYTKIGNYYADNNAGKAIEYYENAEKLAKKLNTPLSVAKNESNIAYCYLLKGDFDKSLGYYFQSVRLFDELKDSSRLANGFMSIADVYFKYNNIKKTDEYYNKSQHIIERLHDKSLLFNLFSSKAHVYDKRGLFDTSLQYAQKAYQLAVEFKDDNLIASMLSDIGLTYKHQKKTAEALRNFDNALTTFKKIGADPGTFASIYNNIGATYAQVGKYALAEEAFTKSIAISTKAAIPYITMEDYRNLSDMYGSNKHFDLQALYLKKYYIIKDSLFSAGNKNQLTQLEADYKIDQKNIELIKQEGEVDKQRSQRNIFIVIALASALLLTTLGVFYNRIRKTNQLLETKNTQIGKQKDEIQTVLQNLKTTQAQLIQSEKLASLGELTAGIAHEIQNPLNFVNNFSEVSADMVSELREELDRGDTEEAKAIADDLRQNLQKITHHGSRASAIVRGMLEHSRSSTGEKLPTNLNVLADEYLKIAYHGLRSSVGPVGAKSGATDRFNCKLVTDFYPALPRVAVMPQEIGRVLLNLYNNAFYAVQERSKRLAHAGDLQDLENYVPTVTVTTHQVEERVDIRVSDNGTGISDAVKAKIFQPFFTTKPTGEGTGLGLSLSYDIVTKGHGGTLHVESREGEGTTFIISIPILSA